MIPLLNFCIKIFARIDTFKQNSFNFDFNLIANRTLNGKKNFAAFWLHVSQVMIVNLKYNIN